MQIGTIDTVALGLERSVPAQQRQASSEASHFADALRAQVAQKTDGTVSAQRTQLSTAEAQDALRTAWNSHFGEVPREETVAVLTAQWSHETGNGRSMFNYNFGGIKGVGPSGMTVNQRTREGSGASETVIRDNFRAYRSADEGAADYLSLLVRKYPAAVEAAHQGDPAAFVQNLKKGGYFTGDESAYISSVTRRTESILGQLPSAATAAASPLLGPRLVNHHLPPQPAQATHMARLPRNPELPEQVSLPNSFQLQDFDDAISRAALRIALQPLAGRNERT